MVVVEGSGPSSSKDTQSVAHEFSSAVDRGGDDTGGDDRGGDDTGGDDRGGDDTGGDDREGARSAIQAWSSAGALIGAAVKTGARVSE